MQSPDHKVDVAQMNAAFDKVLALRAGPKAKRKKHTQRKVGHPPPAKAGKNNAQSAVR